MAHDTTTFFKYAKVSMISCGMWPFETYNSISSWLYKFYRLVLRIEMIGSLLLLGPLMLPYAYKNDKTLFSETLSYEIQYTLLLLKVWVFESAEARKLLKESLAIEKEMLRKGDPVELGILKKNQKINVRLSIIYSVLVCNALVLYCPSVLYKTEINWIEFKSHLNESISPKHVKRQAIVFTLPFLPGVWFYVGLAAQLFGIISVIIYSIATMSAFYGFVTFTVAQIQALRNSLEKFEEYVNKAPGCSINKENALRAQKQNIFTHQKLVRYVTRLNSFLKYPILFDFFFYSLQIGATVNKIISELKEGEYSEMLFHINYFCFNYLGLHFSYRNAHEIIFESSNLSTSIYESKWYEQPVQIRQNYILMMMKMKNPLCLSIGPLYAMSNELLILIIKAAYSYVALLSKSS